MACHALTWQQQHQQPQQQQNTKHPTLIIIHS